MKIRKYRAATMREALAEAKRELGADALIVASREIRRGVLGAEVEVTAAIDVDEPDATTPAFVDSAPRAYGPGSGRTTGRMASASASASASAATSPASAPSLEEADVERIIAPLRAELRSLRSLIRPLGEVGQEVAALRVALAAAGRVEPPPVPHGRAVVAPTERRVVVLVGPTGVGKTTTVAKLAARAALVERRRVGLVSLDDYRVGGAEQIRTYADLIGVPLHLVDDPTGLRGALDRLRDCEQVFVDTAGRSPRDRAALWALERALEGRADLEVHLAVAAATPPQQLEEIVARHRGMGPARLLYTKCDEATASPELVRAPARLELPVTWLTTGQRVPEDLEDATVDRLTALAERGGEGIAA